MAGGKLTIRIIGDAKSFTGALDTASEGISSFAAGAGKVLAAGLATAGIAGAAAFTGAFIESIDQGAELDAVAARAALDPAEQEAAGRLAGDIYAGAYGESFGQVADAVAAVSDQLTDGFADESQIESLTTKALDFATAFDQDVSRSIQNAENLVTSGLAESADEAFDLMVAGTQEASAAVRDEVGDAVNEYSQFFGQLGIDGAEAFGLLGRASNDFEVDKIGDALKELTIRATDMSTSSVEAYDTVGLSAEDMAARFLAGGDTARGALDDLVDGLQSVEDPVERTNAAIALFGTPLEELGTSELDEFIIDLEDLGAVAIGSQDAAEQLGDTLNDNLATKIESLKRGALQGLTDFMTGSVVPAVEGVVDAWGEGGLAGALSHIGERIAQAGPAIATAAGEWGDSLVGWVQNSLPGLLEQLGVAAQTAADWLVTTGLPVLTEQLSVWGLALADWIVEAVPPMLEKFLELREAVVNWLLEEGLPALRENLAVWASEFVEWVGPAIADLLPKLGELLGETVNWMATEALPALITNLAEWGWAFLDWIVTGVIPELPGLLLGILTGILAFADEAIGDIDETVAGWADSFVDWVLSVPGRLGTAAAGMFDPISDAFRGAINGIIRLWNDLSFELPTITIPGIGTIGGTTISTPNIPLLAEGGDITRGGLAVVGDAGPELLSLPGGARVTPLNKTGGPHVTIIGEFRDSREAARAALDEMSWMALA